MGPAADAAEDELRPPAGRSPRAGRGGRAPSPRPRRCRPPDLRAAGAGGEDRGAGRPRPCAGRGGAAAGGEGGGAAAGGREEAATPPPGRRREGATRVCGGGGPLVFGAGRKGGDLEIALLYVHVNTFFFVPVPN